MSFHKVGHVRVINPNREEICINKGMIVGSTEPSESYATVLSSEDVRDENELSCNFPLGHAKVVRVKTNDEADPPKTLEDLQRQLPCHVHKIFTTAAAGRDSAEQLIIKTYSSKMTLIWVVHRSLNTQLIQVKLSLLEYPLGGFH
jgi:hypothetical protein